MPLLMNPNFIDPNSLLKSAQQDANRQQMQHSLLSRPSPYQVRQTLGAATSTWPVVGDAIGLLADMDMYKNDPSSRTWGNYAMTGLGLLPMVPNAASFGLLGAAGMIGATKGKKAASKAAYPDDIFMDKASRLGLDVSMPWHHGTSNDFHEFMRGAKSSTGMPAGEIADFGTASFDNASDFAKHAVKKNGGKPIVKELYGSADGRIEVDWGNRIGVPIRSREGQIIMLDLLEQMRDGGVKSVIFKNMNDSLDNSSKPADVIAFIRDNKPLIRDRRAALNPDDVLKSGLFLGATGMALSTGDTWNSKDDAY